MSSLTDCIVRISSKKVEDMIVGQKEDMESKATLCIVDNFDCGLLGHGAYKSLLFTQKNLLTENAVIVPHAAKVYAIAIQLRTTSVCGIDMSEMNSFRWGPHYEPIQLDTTNHIPLSKPVPIFNFDFTTKSIKPDGTNATSNTVEFNIIRQGVLNAVVFWYDLSLYDDIHVSTAPGLGGVNQRKPSQALQYLCREIEVSEGNTFWFVAKRNTTKIMIQVEQKTTSSLQTGLPFMDKYIPRWHYLVLEDELAENTCFFHV